MVVKSPYPPVPPLPEGNIHDFCFNRPDQATWADFTLYINAETGLEIKFSEHKQRILLAASVLGGPVEKGGLGLQAGQGELVGIIGFNSLDYITLVHSLVYLTIPPVLISGYSTSTELTHALTVAKATRLFVDAPLLERVLSVARKFGIPSDRVYVLGGSSHQGYRSFEQMITLGRHLPPIPVQPAQKTTLAYLLFSSGTTGLPKAVMLSHGNIRFIMAQVLTAGAYIMKAAPVIAFGPTFDSIPLIKKLHNQPIQPPLGVPICLAYLPLSSTYGLHYYTISPCTSPMTFVLMRKWDIRAAITAFRRYKITMAAFVPSIIHQLVNYPGIEHVGFSSITSSLSATAYLPPELSNKLKKLLPKTQVSEGWGMTESSAMSIAQPPPSIFKGDIIRASGSIGVLHPGVEARVVREDGADANVDEAGELLLRGDNVALGYRNDEQATRNTFLPDGWLKTGDRVRVNKDGHFFFLDRIKDVLKVSGAQVSPAEIEDVLLANPRKMITDITVAGVSGGRTVDEKVPRAWVVLSPAGKKLGNHVVLKELESWHKQSLSKYKWLRGGIEVVEEIPKSSMGKVLKRVLVERFEKSNMGSKL